MVKIGFDMQIYPQIVS